MKEIKKLLRTNSDIIALSAQVTQRCKVGKDTATSFPTGPTVSQWDCFGLEKWHQEEGPHSTYTMILILVVRTENLQLIVLHLRQGEVPNTTLNSVKYGENRPRASLPI